MIKTVVNDAINIMSFGLIENGYHLLTNYNLGLGLLILFTILIIFLVCKQAIKTIWRKYS